MNDHFFAQLEAEGEDAVRRKVAGGFYGRPGAARSMAEHWLAIKDRARNEAYNLEQTRIARSAKNAAWIAAFVAIVATIIAAVSMLLAYLALS